MNLKTAIIDLESIQLPPLPTGQATVIEALANTVIQLKGLVNIPVLRMVAIDDYELLSGQLEFHAYLKARDMDNSLPDRLTVFIADQTTEKPIQKQLAVLATIAGSSVNSHPTNLDTGNLSAQIDRLSKSQDGSFAALQSIIIATIQDTIPQPLPMLTAFNRIQEPQVAIQTSKNLAFLGNKKVQKIVERLQAARQQGQEFKSFAEVMVVLVETRNQKQFKLVSDKRMLEMIDRWG